MLPSKQLNILIFTSLLFTGSLTFAASSPEAESDGESPIEEVVVVGTRKANYTEITESAEKLVAMPGAMGDPLGAITALPGVIAPVDGGGNGPAVRGSSPNDNRYYIDGIPAGYIFHQFNTSVLDENVVQDFQVFTAGFGAQYADATGAVFDVRLRDPKHVPFQTTVTASLLRAGVFMESGIGESAAFYLSARKGLIQFFLPEEDEANDEGIRIISAPEDSDYQAKLMYEVNSGNTLSLVFAGARDFAEAELTDGAGFVQENPDFGGDAKLESNFNSYGLTWRYEGANGQNLSLTLANYRNSELLRWGDNYYIESTLDDNIIKGQWYSQLGESHGLTAGFEYNDYDYDYDARLVLFVCSEFDVDCQQGRREVIEDDRRLDLPRSSAYLIDRWLVTDSLDFELGVQWQHNNYTDESFIHPRLSVEWQTWPSVAITSSAGSYNRLPDIETIMPVIGNPQLQSPQADHFTLGLKGVVGIDWDWSLEFYHKKLTQLPLALDEAQADSSDLYSNEVKGEARGVDLFLNRNLADNWYGWLALSYSHSERTNTRTRETREYFLDTPLVLNMVATYQISDNWDLGFRLTAKSGQATTEIIGVRENPDFEDSYLPVYGDPYQDRLPTFVQLDFRAERKLRLFDREGSLYFDVLNALNRQNISSVGLDYDKVNESGELYLEREAGFGIFPSVGMSIVF